MPIYTYDAAHIPLAAILAAKPVAMCAYTDGSFGYDRGTIQTLLQAGIGIWPNHENAQNELLGGHAAGVAAAQKAMAAVAAWGCPNNGTVDIVYSVDESVPSTKFPTIRDAFDGINETHNGRFISKLYGEGALIDYLVGQGRVQVGDWLSASSSFPGYNVNDANVGVWQQVGSDIGNTDRDVITHIENINAWWLGARPLGSGSELGQPTTSPTPVPTTMEDEDDMAVGLYVEELEGTPQQNTWFIIGGNRIRCATPQDAANAVICTQPGGGEPRVWVPYSMTPDQLAAFPDITVYPK